MSYHITKNLFASKRKIFALAMSFLIPIGICAALVSLSQTHGSDRFETGRRGQTERPYGFRGYNDFHDSSDGGFEHSDQGHTLGTLN